MRLAAEGFEGQTSLVGRAGGGVVDLLAKDGERAPDGERLESKNNLDIRPTGHIANQRKVLTEQLLVHYITRRRELGEVNHI